MNPKCPVQRALHFSSKEPYIADFWEWDTELNIATHCSTLQHTATHCNTLQHTAIHCSTLQHICNALQHTATHCNTLQHTATANFWGGERELSITNLRARILQHTATHCNTLQHTATHCNTLQQTTSRMRERAQYHDSTSPRTETHCNTLQHSAIHCNSQLLRMREWAQYRVAKTHRIP